MKTKLLLITILIVLVTPVLQAGSTSYKLFETPDTVVSTATITSASVEMKGFKHFSVDMKATSVVGTPDLLVTYEISNDNVNWVTPDRAVDIWTNLADELQHCDTFSPTPARYLRIKVKGNGGNPADTIVGFLYLTLVE